MVTAYLSPTIGELCAAIGGRGTGGDLGGNYSGASLNSRSLGRGDIFFAVRGARTDGHRWVADAAKHGASAAVVERYVPAVRRRGGFPILRVAGTAEALRRGAAWHRRRFHLPVIGITGSNGKTTVKDLTAWVLRGALGNHVLATKGNFNNQLGVPLTVFGMNSSVRAAVVEMAMNAKGEIRRLSRIAAPGVGVLLNVGQAHMWKFASKAEIACAKAELIQELPTGGWAILNSDDENVWRRRRMTSARVFSFGMRSGDVRAERVWLNRASGAARFLLRTPTGSARVRLKLPGVHSATNAAAAAAVAWVFGMKTAEIARRLESFSPSAGMRLEIRRMPHGGTALVDCYNANPDSCRVALAYLRDMGIKRPVLVLGEMHELGRHAVRVHREVGVQAARLRPKLLVGIGPGARSLVEAARRIGVKTFWSARPVDALPALELELKHKAFFLFKASRKLELERLVDRLGSTRRAV